MKLLVKSDEGREGVKRETTTWKIVQKIRIRRWILPVKKVKMNWT